MDVAETVPDLQWKTLAFCDVAKQLAVTDPKQATTVLEEVLTLATVIKNDWRKTWAIQQSANLFMTLLPQTTVEFTQGISDEYQKSATLKHLVWAIARSDPQYALRLADGITDNRCFDKDSALEHIVEAIMEDNPQLALQIADKINQDSTRESARADISLILAKTDPEQAFLIANETRVLIKAFILRNLSEELLKTHDMSVDFIFQEAVQSANLIEHDRARAYILHDMAVAWAKTNPDQAIKIIDRLHDEKIKISGYARLAGVWEKTIPEQSQRVFEKALSMATDVTDENERWDALKSLAFIKAETNLPQALQLADAITHRIWKDATLCGIATAVAKKSLQQAMTIVSDTREYKDNEYDDATYNLTRRQNAIYDIARIHCEINLVETLICALQQTNVADREMMVKGVIWYFDTLEKDE